MTSDGWTTVPSLPSELRFDDGPAPQLVVPPPGPDRPGEPPRWPRHARALAAAVVGLSLIAGGLAGGGVAWLTRSQPEAAAPATATTAVTVPGEATG
jgi:hypothetical protein